MSEWNRHTCRGSVLAVSMAALLAALPAGAQEGMEPRLKDEPPPPDLSGPPDLGTGGPGGVFNLPGTPGGAKIGGRPHWGRYAGIVQTRVEEALLADPRTRKMGGCQVQLWVDDSGRVARARLSRSSGDPAVDALLAEEVFPGLRFQEPPPKDIPMPIVVTLTARRSR